MSKFTSIALAAFTGTVPINAWADVVPPVASDGYEFGCRVTGLDPNGDGFLAIRTGPGSKYRKKGEVYNGDTIGVTRDCSGNWCYAESILRQGRDYVDLKGWFQMNWCHVYAG